MLVEGVSMKTLLRVVVLCLAVPAGLVLAQGHSTEERRAGQEKPAAQEKPMVSPANPLSTWNKFAYARVKDVLRRAAEKMPEENYSFKSAETVRRCGRVCGHWAE